MEARAREDTAIHVVVCMVSWKCRWNLLWMGEEYGCIIYDIRNDFAGKRFTEEVYIS